MRSVPPIAVLTLAVALGGRSLAHAQVPPPPPPPTPQELFRTDVHATKGLTCDTCHTTGTDGKYALIKKTEIAPLCARCHADASYMHKSNPRIPVGQYADWKQSVHAAAIQHGDTSAPACSNCHGAHGVRPVDTIKAEEVCGQCHVREADLYKASPKKKIFEETDHPGCVTCHENHKIVTPGDNWISMKDPVSPCSTCHDDSMKGAKEITLEQQSFQRLTASIDRASAVLDRAERVGMLVDDGRDAVRDAKEKQIQARVMVHTFAAKPFSAAADGGIKDAARAEQIGNQALSELQFRRKGLMIATVLIVCFLVTLGVYIRRLPPIEK
jgi:predicted CXXCH cytochrome family protein